MMSGLPGRTRQAGRRRDDSWWGSCNRARGHRLRERGTGGADHRLRQVSKSFGAFEALRSVSVDVFLGERWGLWPFGIRQVDLVRCVGGLERHDAGDDAVDGVALDDRRESIASIRSRIGMVFQQFNLFPHLTVLRNLTLGPMRARGMTKAEADDLGDPLPRTGAHPGTGPQVSARAFRWPAAAGRDRARPVHGAPHHAVRRADFRPGSGDDQRSARGDGRARGERDDDDLRHHEMGFARRVADQMVFMDHGEIVEMAEPERFFSRPESERCRDFLQRSCTLAGRVVHPREHGQPARAERVGPSAGRRRMKRGPMLAVLGTALLLAGCTANWDGTWSTPRRSRGRESQVPPERALLHRAVSVTAILISVALGLMIALPGSGRPSRARLQSGVRRARPRGSHPRAHPLVYYGMPQLADLSISVFWAG